MWLLDSNVLGLVGELNISMVQSTQLLDGAEGILLQTYLVRRFRKE